MNNEERRKLHKELRDILKFTPPIDGLLSSMTGILSLDVVRLDEMLGRRLPHYDDKEATYEGKKASMRDVVVTVYGERAAEIIKILIAQD